MLRPSWPSRARQEPHLRGRQGVAVFPGVIFPHLPYNKRVSRGEAPFWGFVIFGEIMIGTLLLGLSLLASATPSHPQPATTSRPITTVSRKAMNEIVPGLI